MTAREAPAALPWERTTDTAAETERFGSELAALAGDAPMFLLEGELGAGKTTLTRGLAAGLGADPQAVHSPTYSLVHVYRDAAGRPVLYHVDLYRVDGVLDLEEIGLEELCSAGVPVAVEWPERLAGSDLRPRAGDLRVRLVLAGGERRRLTVEPVDQDSSW